MTLTDYPRRIALVTDFGVGPYVGQIRLLLSGLIPATPVIPLISDLAPFRPDLAAYLLPALIEDMPAQTLYLCVVDPGVGSDRAIIAARVRDHWLIGPDNGLLVPAIRSDPEAEVFRIDWRPPALSDSFHGRDLFAPLAAHMVRGALPKAIPIPSDTLVGRELPPQQAKICYVDHYGNLITGIDARTIDRDWVIALGDRPIRHARTFSEVPPGTAFWYANAFRLLEIAVNQARADQLLDLGVGDAIAFSQTGGLPL
ncbi:SAM-dependent chlorinase/fluorinase [Thiohalocapsa marina]|uniref:SAM-dependent chlorinase/fluorinase n=1 Tax=Thiohalocapsa marina TaxID=424902 RepID=A0A5M8FSF6_9GAMM|nr:SAM-dependent chlorinase/fluorinase [Thiohalocapsa marina]KAA6184972.1 SAM-dependent chlorinase/fluorinase [Thiohalocapsa marina]